MSTFAETLGRFFPGAVREKKFVGETQRLLRDHGFTAENTLPCVAVCRDEIAGHMVADVEEAWGPSFSLASLAGMVTAGRTGLRAAARHGPVEHGRQHLLIYAMPHIAISQDGAIGQVLREGVPHPSTACGALVGFRGELERGTLSIALDPNDIEQSLLKQRLLPLIGYGEVPSLVELTRLAASAIEEDMRNILEYVSAEDPASPNSGAMFTGIQIHGPDGADYVWPRSGYLAIDGVVRRIDLTS